MTRRYERDGDEGCKASTLPKIRAQETLVGPTVKEIGQRGARQEIEERPGGKVRAVGRDEVAMKTGHREDATGMVDFHM